MTRKLLVLPIWTIYLFVIFVFIKMFLADVYFRKSQDLLKKESTEKALSFANKAVSFNPLEPNYFRGRAKINIVRLGSLGNSKFLKEAVLNDLKIAYSLNPQNLVTIRNSIPLHYFLTMKFMVLGPVTENLDENYLQPAINYLERAKKVYWTDAGVITEVAGYEKKLGLDADYQESVDRIRQIRPDLLEWHDSFR